MRRKDVDDLVRIQEQQDHRDVILASNMAVEKMRLSIAKLEEDHKKEINEYANKINSVECSVKCNKEIAFENYREHRNKISDLQNSELAFKKRCAELSVENQNLHSIIDELTTRVIDNIIDLSGFKKEELQSQQYLEYSIGQIQIKMKSELNSFKKDLDNKPSRYESLLKYVDTKLEEKQIDHDGIYTNIDKFKSKYYIVEKQIENIYTLIKRLEGKK